MIYLIRHGQSEWNLDRISQGQAEAPGLTELGRAQALVSADAVAADLAGARSPAALFTSDLARAAETADIVGSRFGLTPQVDSRLRERSLGRLDGLSYDETHAVVADLDWSDPELRVGGGESTREVYARAAAALSVLVELDAPVLVVSHGDLIRAVLAIHSGLSAGQDFWADVPNGSVAALDGDGPVRWLSLAP